MMMVSCLMPTYNRAPDRLWLIEEAVESFLRQRLPPGVMAELIVLNDTPGQHLEPEAPRVWSEERKGLTQRNVYYVNVPERFKSLGEKRNHLVRMAWGEIVLPWDDDDISLPDRIAQAVAHLFPWMTGGGTVAFNYFNPGASWYLPSDGGPPRPGGGYCHNASAFTKKAWRAVDGYPPTSGNEDALMDGRLRTLGPAVPTLKLTPAAWQYVYRWGVSERHLSSRAGGPADDPHRPHYDEIGCRPVMPGRFTIRPGWRADYASMVAGALR